VRRPGRSRGDATAITIPFPFPSAFAFPFPFPFPFAFALALALVLVLVLPVGGRWATVAADDGDPGGGTVMGLGLGPTAHLGGALGERFTPEGVSGRIRFGGRVGRVGFEIDTSVIGLRGGDLDDAGLMFAVPSLAFYPRVGPHAQLALHAGLGYGALGGRRTVAPPPCLEAPCAAAASESVSYGGYGVELGTSAALHLGRRRGGRAIVWLDLGLTLVRVQLPERVVGGELVTLTIGIAHGLEL
jgi:hypothetical protein